MKTAPNAYSGKYDSSRGQKNSDTLFFVLTSRHLCCALIENWCFSDVSIRGARRSTRGSQRTRQHDYVEDVNGCTSCRLLEAWRRHYSQGNSKFLSSTTLCTSQLYFFSLKTLHFRKGNGIMHTSRVVKCWLADQGIHSMPLSSESPNLHPTVNPWTIVDKRLKDRKLNAKIELLEVLKIWCKVMYSKLMTSSVDSKSKKWKSISD